MNDEIILRFLKEGFPIIRMRVNENGYPSTTGNFKRVIKIEEDGKVYKLSNPNERYSAMYSLSLILCRVFYLKTEAVLPFIKKHLHIT